MADRRGQFGVVRTNGWAGWFIRLGTRSQVNHAFICVGGNVIVEAQPGGARYWSSKRYRDIIWSDFDLTEEQAERVCHAARTMLRTPYNFLDIAALTVASFGIRWDWLTRRAQSEKALICSQLVARCYTDAGITLYPNRPDGTVTPGDLLMLIARQSTATELPAA